MNGSGVQDAIIRSLSDAGYRHSAANPAVQIASVEALDKAARFLARRYYLTRVRRLYRNTGQLSRVTGRIPSQPLHGTDIEPVLDSAVLGSRETAQRIVERVTEFLTREDAGIVVKIPYWRDLVRYDSSYFLVEARTKRPASAIPLANPDALTVEFEWDLPDVMSWSGEEGVPEARRQKTTLIFCCDSKGVVSVARSTDAAMRLMALADGTRSLVALSEAVNYPQERMAALVDYLRRAGALL